MNACVSSTERIGDPSGISMSSTSISAGMTAFSASTFLAYSGSERAASSANASFWRTLPERYSSRGTYCSLTGSLKSLSPSSFMIASSLLPSTLAMYFMSAKPNLRREDASASLVVDMFKSSVAGYAVLSVRIGAFSAVLSLPFVPALYFCSRARSLPAIGEPEI